MSALLPLLDFAVFFAYVFIPGAALGSTRIPVGVPRLLLGIATALGFEFALGFLGFVAGLPNGVTAAAMTVGVAVVIGARWRAIAECSRDRAVRHVVIGSLVFSAWAVGMLASVKTYSGGGWSVDWIEHWQRTEFFLHREPLETRFAVEYTLTSRPPLANLLIALWLEASDRSFASFQIFMTLLGSLITIPAVLLSRHFANRVRLAGDPEGAERLTWLLLMLSPVVAQNLTFSWTKLPTAFFVLTGLVFVLFALFGEEQPAGSLAGYRGGDDATRYGCAAAACLGLGVLTHYSAGPWAIAIACSVLAAVRQVPTPQKRTARGGAAFVLVFGAVLAPWVVWAGAHYGFSALASSTSTGGAWNAESMSERLLVALKNLFDSFVPFPLRGEPGDGLIIQSSELGRIRDVAFNVYQVNLPLSLGLSGLWTLIWFAVTRKQQRASVGAGAEDGTRGCRSGVSARRFWWVLLPLAAVLGIIVHTPRDEWGLAHICLQPLVVVGLAFAAAVLCAAPVNVRCMWVALAALDCALGMVLHLGLESWVLRPLVTASPDPWMYLRQLSHSAWVNANDKWALQLAFVSDRWPVPAWIIAVWLALCLAFVVMRIIRGRTAHQV